MSKSFFVRKTKCRYHAVTLLPLLFSTQGNVVVIKNIGREYIFAISHFRMCVRDVTLSLLHVPATRPFYMSPLCEQRTILWLQHAVETWPCVMTPSVRAVGGGWVWGLLVLSPWGNTGSLMFLYRKK